MLEASIRVIFIGVWVACAAKTELAYIMETQIKLLSALSSKVDLSRNSLLCLLIAVEDIFGGLPLPR